MQLHADFSRRVAIATAELPWSPSPTPGVERRMLDRLGGEIARATSIVRYASASRFPPHTHTGGEEFFVLDGVFQDEHGDFPAGTYVRNPPTSAHTPGSAPGCTIFVKLWQFDPADRRHVRIDTTTAAFAPAPGRLGVERMPLFTDDIEDVRLERWAPGAEVTLALAGGAELLVLDGSFTESDELLPREAWLRLPPGSTLRARAGAAGTRLWIKTGHLAARTWAPPLP